MNLDWLANPAWLLVNALVAYRLTRLVVDDSVPFGMVRSRFIDWANERWAPLRKARSLESWTIDDERQFTVFNGTAPLAYLVGCYWCVGLWVSIAVMLGASLIPAFAWSIIAAPLALSALVGVLASHAD